MKNWGTNVTFAFRWSLVVFLDISAYIYPLFHYRFEFVNLNTEFDDVFFLSRFKSGVCFIFANHRVLSFLITHLPRYFPRVPIFEWIIHVNPSSAKSKQNYVVHSEEFIPIILRFMYIGSTIKIVINSFNKQKAK